MSEPWKCCSECRCPCKNNDICADTAAHIISEGKQNIANDSSLKSNGSEYNLSNTPSNSLSNSLSNSPSNTPSLEELIRLEQRIDHRIKNMQKISDSDHSHHISDVSSVSSSDSGRTPTDRQIYYNEILILRKRLQEAELRNAIIEEKVERLERSHHSMPVSQLNQLKQQIIAFIEEKFSQFLQKQ